MEARTRSVLLGMLAVVGASALMIMRGPKTASADPTSTLKPYERHLNRAEASFSGTLRRFVVSHAEFGLNAPMAGRYAQIVADDLDPEQKPVFRSGGRLVATPWTDGAEHWLTPRSYINTRPGDRTGALGGSDASVASGASSFSQLFRTIPGVNTETSAPLTVRREGAVYAWEGPIDSSDATGTPATLELSNTFVQATGAGWYFEVETDADVWGFIDGRLVIDGGAGAHMSASSASGSRPFITVSDTIELNNSCTLSSGDGTPVLVQTNSTRNRAVTMGQGCTIDGDVMVGPGGSSSQVVLHSGSAITGKIEPLSAANAIPDVVFPSSGPVTGDYTVRDAVDVSANMHVRDLTIFTGGRMRVHGDVTIVCDGSVRLSSGGNLDVMPGATLRLYSVGEIFISADSTLNNVTRDPRQAMLATRTTGRVTVNSRSGVYADVLAPRGSLLVNNDSSFAGSFIGGSVRMNNGASFHTGSMAAASESASAAYRIDLDRLSWLADGATHTLQFFVADRDGTASRMRIRTNITAMNLAALPHVGGFD